jgi:hypothetical protein
MERMVHALLPPSGAAVVAFELSISFAAELGSDIAATLVPLVFAGLLLLGMIFLGCAESSFVTPTKSTANGVKGGDNDDDKNNGKTHHIATNTSILPTRYARAHSTLLLLTPALMHTMMFRRRIISLYASKDDLLDLILVWAVPYLLHYVLHQLHVSGRLQGPYSFPSSFFTNFLFPRSGNTLRGTFIPLMVSLAASIACQQRYLIPLCHQVCYQFKGHDLPSVELVSICLSVATFFMVAGGWIWGAYSSETNEPLFGEFHEDVVQVLFALAGLFGGMALGMPWGLIPLPILAFLGLSLWLSTRLVSSDDVQCTVS